MTLYNFLRFNVAVLNTLYYIPTINTLQIGQLSGRGSPEVACWISNHWVAGLNPLGGGGGHLSLLISPHYLLRFDNPV